MSAPTMIEMAAAMRMALAEQRTDEAAAERFTLRLLGDAPLKQKAVTIASADATAPGLVRALKREMHRFSGLGMAAQQVGGVQRVCVVRLSRKSGVGGPRTDVVLINPSIVAKSPETRICPQEGCLSVPGFRTSRRRHPWIEVRYQTETFETKQEHLVDLDAQVVQHEIDHLDGVCIADHLPRQQRRQAEALVARARARA